MENNKLKVLKEQSFIMDINILEAPFFLFNQSTKGLSIRDLESDPNITDNVRHILKTIPEQNKNSEAKYFKWTDSKGLIREMLALSTLNLPRKFTMDVWYGLIGLYVHKMSPIWYDSNTKTFDVKDDFLYFTLYELARFMKLSTGGREITKIKDAIRELKSAQYFSMANGSIYDKSKNKYVTSKERGLSLILDYGFDLEKKEKNKIIEDKNWVQFNKLVIDNIKYEFIKYLNSETYFTLPSGLTRGLYTYLEGNKYDNNGKVLMYIKRSYEVLSNKIPIEYRYVSDLKSKLKKPLQNLIEYGIISDYFYGDEIVLNDKKEESIYFICVGKKEDVIKALEYKKYKQLEISLDLDESEFKMTIPTDLSESLERIGFKKNVIQQLLKQYDKWAIIKYIIWLQQKQFENKKTVSNSAGLLRFALEGNVNLEIGYKHIIDFVENAKIEHEDNEKNKEKLLKDTYDQYIKDEIEKFKTEDEGAYTIIYENTLLTINAEVDTRIAQLTLLLQQDKEIESHIRLWKEFKEKQGDSELFNQNFLRSIMLLRGIKTFEEFSIEYLKNKE